MVCFDFLFYGWWGVVAVGRRNRRKVLEPCHFTVSFPNQTFSHSSLSNITMKSLLMSFTHDIEYTLILKEVKF